MISIRVLSGIYGLKDQNNLFVEVVRLTFNKNNKLAESKLTKNITFAAHFKKYENGN